MKRLLLAFLVIESILLFSSCVTGTIKASSKPSTINVNKNIEVHDIAPLHDVFVVIHIPEINIEYSKETVGTYFLKKLKNEFEIRSIKTEYKMYDDIAKQKKFITDDQKYSQTLIVELKNEILGKGLGYNYLEGGDFVLSIVDNESSKELWKGVVSIEQKYIFGYNLLAVPESSIADVVDKLFTALTQDKYVNEIKYIPIP